MLLGVGYATYTHSAPSLPRKPARQTSIPAQRPNAQPTDSPGLPGTVGRAPELPPHLRPLTPPVIKAPCAILIDAVSGQVLFEQNADVQRPMASTTKIMTALLFCENVPDTAVITASKYAASIRDSSLHIKEGEKISAHDLLRAILMRSANDGCVAAAEYTSGTEAAFVAKMNERARQLGATHTHFTNPHGLHNPLHYTTARDLALIARAAMEESRICEVVRMQKCRITRSMD
ncbi:MAG TPA: serine hydrolase, partial [Chthonomonadaceae bacterium]|nr:serine hydrolase [Chthonomonadaceae bacterium]